ncbi:MAG: hypothetical protein LBD30_07015 [Verrucomicrobiales bacterium]|jgi:hypothetical protein|nr:hypothetical protein [Verrucomicrobiales bacterium]
MRKMGSLSAVVLFGVILSVGHAAENSPAFGQFAQAARSAALKQGTTLLVTYDGKKRLLQVAEEMRVNQFRKLTQVQTVPIDKLADEAELISLGGRAEPWLKIPCRDQRRAVQLDSTREINGVHDGELDKEERLSALILPGHPAELKKVMAAYAEFKKSVGH